MDDTLVTGTKGMIDWFCDIVQEKFTITDLGELKKHLGIWYRWKTDSKGERYVEATMSKLADEIQESYEQSSNKNVTEKATPGTPCKVLTKTKDLLNANDHKQYRSVVGKLMYYCQKIAP